jgi:hypothetical protein
MNEGVNNDNLGIVILTGGHGSCYLMSSIESQHLFIIITAAGTAKYVRH